MSNPSDLGGLHPTGIEPLQLPSGRIAETPICRVRFQPWTGEPIDSYNGKPILDYAGTPLYAELVVLRMLEAAGWKGYWVDTYGRRFRNDVDGAPISGVAIKSLQSTPPFQKYPAGFAKFGGCWDVVAWKGNSILFCECKRSKKDAIRHSQLRWMEDRLKEGAGPENFLLIEWTTR